MLISDRHHLIYFSIEEELLINLKHLTVVTALFLTLVPCTYALVQALFQHKTLEKHSF